MCSDPFPLGKYDPESDTFLFREALAAGEREEFALGEAASAFEADKKVEEVTGVIGAEPVSR